jgi:hypothetical protein
MTVTTNSNMPYNISSSQPTRDADTVVAGLTGLDSDIQRTTQVAKPVFSHVMDRARATKEYSVSEKFKFGIYLPLKGVFATLSKDETTNLDLYKKHNQLCAGVDKVKKAYKNYCEAEKAVKAVKEDSKLRGACEVESSKGEILIKSYKELIQLADAQAKELNISSADYKAELHKAMDKDNQSLIFSTVNMVRAKWFMGNSLFESEILPKTYLEFVSNFVEYVHEAVVSSGCGYENVEMITEAFIKGLASIPELSQDLMIIQCHAELVELLNSSTDENREARQRMNQDVVDAFTRQLNELINSDQTITEADLKKIRYQGISLLSVKNFTQANIKFLEWLQRSAKDLRGVKEQISEHKKALQMREGTLNQVLTTKVGHSVKEIEKFLQGAYGSNSQGVNNRTLETAVDGDAVLTPGFVKYRELSTALAEVDQHIEDLNEHAKEENIADIKKVSEAQQSVDDINGQINQLTNQATAINAEVTTLEENLSNFIAEHELAKKKWDSLIKKQELVFKHFGKSIEEVEEKHKDETKRRQGEIADKKVDRDAILAQVGILQTDLQPVKADLEQLTTSTSENESKNQELLASLTAEREELANTTVELSGQDIIELRDYLDLEVSQGFIGSTVNNEFYNTVYRELNGVLSACDARDRAKDDLLPLTEQANRLEQEIKEALEEYPNPDTLKYTSEGRVVFNPQVFFMGAEGFIQSLIDSNLVIAEEITVRVGDALVRDINQERELARQEQKLVSRRRALAPNVALKTILEEKLEGIERSDDDRGLNSEISRRIKMLSTQANTVIDDKHTKRTVIIEEEPI